MIYVLSQGPAHYGSMRQGNRKGTVRLSDKSHDALVRPQHIDLNLH